MVAGFDADDSIDLGDFLFSGSPIISGVSGAGDVGTATTITITYGTVSTQLALINQYAVDASAYTLAAMRSEAPPEPCSSLLRGTKQQTRHRRRVRCDGAAWSDRSVLP